MITEVGVAPILSIESMCPKMLVPFTSFTFVCTTNSLNPHVSGSSNRTCESFVGRILREPPVWSMPIYEQVWVVFQ